MDNSTDQLKRIADAITEILRLVKEGSLFLVNNTIENRKTEFVSMQL
jgi:hypothetical protein